jgi:hypothetical protein
LVDLVKHKMIVMLLELVWQKVEVDDINLDDINLDDINLVNLEDIEKREQE